MAPSGPLPTGGSNLRVLVCGGRDYKNRSRVFEVLDRLWAEHGALTIIEGGAVGADTFAGEWSCTQRTSRLVTEHANWDKFGKPAEPIRSQKMIDDHKPNLVMRFLAGAAPPTWFSRRGAQASR